ncbi:two-component system OmpR family sensor kinase [Duganella sp. 3397]|uniref:sensor histidine kinase n=1 Tax=Duganella sp. 3397 TaxID=2817732 RepID=UPI002858742B|nr:ATP-binding protein [Duganella sp. 3397]MDR7051185.1 two-component system OmpR family sensor kinase [Duganella sp. 3397]
MLSLRQRLIAVHLLAILAAVGATAGAGWWVLSQSVNRQLDTALLALAEAEAAMLSDSDGTVIRVHEAPQGSAPPSLTRLDRLVQIIDKQGWILARSSNLGTEDLPASSQLLEQLAAGRTVFETLPDTSEEPLRMVSVPARVKGQLYAVQVAGSLDDANSTLRSAALLFGAMAVALMAALGWAGARLSRKLFVAIENIVEQAGRIEDNHLDRRLPHPGGDDEIGHLVTTLNAMLERIEGAFETQRRFTADASHELRSPLSRLRAEIEITLRRPRESGDYVAALRSCLDEVERLTTLVEELLMLARIDAGQERGPGQPVSLTDLVRDTVARMAAPARERGIELVDASDLPGDVQVEQAALGLVLRNLLENALKFSPPGGRIEVGLARGEGTILLTVADQGPGIADAELPYVFDRFFRGTGARASEVAGVGLGLALSQSIMRAAGGRITAANRPGGGALFTVQLQQLQETP